MRRKSTTLTARINVPFTEADKARIVEEATAQNTTPVAWVRDLVLHRIGGAAETPPVRPVSLKPSTFFPASDPGQSVVDCPVCRTGLHLNLRQA